MKEVELPDFDSMMVVINSIAEISKQVALLDIEIRTIEDSVTRVAMSDPRYLVNGKPPSMDFIKTTYMRSGFSGEITGRRKQLAELEVELFRLKNTLEWMKSQVDVWRTVEANKRSATY